MVGIGEQIGTVNYISRLPPLSTIKNKKAHVLAKLKAVYLEWVDSASRRGWFAYDKELDGYETICSVGILLGETPDVVTITCSLGGDGQAMSPLSIPKSAIRRRKPLSMPK